MVFIVIITRLNHLPHPNYRPGTVKLSGTVKNAQGKTDASRDIVLDKGSITLDEVEVTASNVIVGAGNVNILAMGGANFSRTDYTGSTITETYKLNPEFTKYSHYDVKAKATQNTACYAQR